MDDPILVFLKELNEIQYIIHSEKTREGLVRAKNNGKILGRPIITPKEIEQLILSFKNEGLSYRQICNLLNEKNILPAGGGKQWYPTSIVRLIKRAKNGT